MRLHRTLPQGSSLEFTAFFMNRSLASRMLMLGLPLLALVLLIIFTATGSSIEAILDRAIARNAQLQSQAMSLALEQALEETRNQLLRIRHFLIVEAYPFQDILIINIHSSSATISRAALRTLSMS